MSGSTTEHGPGPDEQRRRRELNQDVIDEFRANAGRVTSGPFAAVSLLLLHTRGARSGQERISPLAYLADGQRWVVFAANGGRATAPGWWHNLLAEPGATIEVGAETVAVRAEQAQGEERQRLWDEHLRTSPYFAPIAAATSRAIPVVVLTRTR
jgi:deazaflavin-dependent oxidoreductase (nitroreductase family)